MTKNSNIVSQKIVTLLILLTLLPSCGATRWNEYFAGDDDILISRNGDGLIADTENALYDDSASKADKVEPAKIKKVTRTKFVDNRKTVQQIQKTDNKYSSEKLEENNEKLQIPAKPELSVKKEPVKVAKIEPNKNFRFDQKLITGEKQEEEKTKKVKSQYDLTSFFVTNKNKQESEDKESKYTISYKFATFYYADGGTYLDSKYRTRIREIVKLSKKYGGKVRVIGHASSRTKNMDLASHNLANFVTSVKRAEKVAQELLNAGLKKENLIIEAYSDREPIYAEIMPAGEDMNRRTEVYIDY